MHIKKQLRTREFNEPSLNGVLKHYVGRKANLILTLKRNTCTVKAVHKQLLMGELAGVTKCDIRKGGGVGRGTIDFPKRLSDIYV